MCYKPLERCKAPSYACYQRIYDASSFMTLNPATAQGQLHTLPAGTFRRGGDNKESLSGVHGSRGLYGVPSSFLRGKGLLYKGGARHRSQYSIALMRRTPKKAPNPRKPVRATPHNLHIGASQKLHMDS